MWKSAGLEIFFYRVYYNNYSLFIIQKAVVKKNKNNFILAFSTQ